MNTQQEGFRNELLVILPREITEQLEQHPLTSSLYITDMGRFPDAPRHLVEQPNGNQNYIIIYCHKGQGWFQIEGKQKRTVNEEQYFVIPANQAYSYGADVNNSWSVSWIHFSGHKAEEFFQSLTGGDSDKVHSGQNFSDELIQELAFDLKSSPSFVTASRASLALWQLFGKTIFSNTTRKSRDIENSVDYMNENLKKDLSLKEIAEQSGFSASRFSLLFKKQYNSSPIEYFIKLRMERACHYLQTSSMKVQEVAEQLGYEDPYYFSRIFTRVVGVSPRQYRK